MQAINLVSFENRPKHLLRGLFEDSRERERSLAIGRDHSQMVTPAIPS